MKLMKFQAMALFIALCATLGAVQQSYAGDYTGNFVARVGVTGVLPQTDFESVDLVGLGPIPGASADVDDAIVPSLTLAYFVNQNIAIELFCCFAQHGVDGRGSLSGLELGETWIFPPALTLQYHFNPVNGMKPYVGAGVQYINFFDTSSEIGGKLDIDEAWVFTLQAGADFELGRGWYLNGDLKYTFLETDAHFRGALGGAADIDTEFKLNPLIATLAIGYRFDLFGRRSVPLEPMK